jgi:hypothetical protein
MTPSKIYAAKKDEDNNEILIKRMLVPLDGSSCSMRAATSRPFIDDYLNLLIICHAEVGRIKIGL